MALSDERLHRRGFRPRVPPWPVCTQGRPILQESRIQHQLASQLALPWPFGLRVSLQTGEIGANNGAHADPLLGGSAETPAFPHHQGGALFAQRQRATEKPTYLTSVGSDCTLWGWRTPMSFLPRAASRPRYARHGAVETSRKGLCRVSKMPCKAHKD